MDLRRFLYLIVKWFRSILTWIEGRQASKTIQISGFPHLIPAEEVKDFIEEYAGEGSVVALKVEKWRQGERASARVQFNSGRCSEKLVKMASDGLYYRDSYLKAKEWDSDMVHNVRTYPYEMEGITLNIGCQISDDKFSVLWKVSVVLVKFESGLKNMHFLFRCDSFDYRLQLLSENVGQIVLYHQPGHTAKLFIKLLGAPRIYYKKVDDSYIYSFYTDTLDDRNWIRTTDFTASSCIGQSSGLCLQFPSRGEHPNVKEIFASYLQTENSPNSKDMFPSYRESENPFYLEAGLPFCRGSALVPIIQPPPEVDLPFTILFKVCSLVQKGSIPGPNLDASFFRLINPQHIHVNYIEHALEKLYYSKECCFNPAAWLLAQYEKYRTLQEHPNSPAIQLNAGLMYVHRVQVTPSKVYFLGPEVNTSNRVLRHYKDYIDNFLRVSFVDEELEKLYSNDLCTRVGGAGEYERTKVYERVLSTLKDGIRIGDKKFDFLAFSSSQIRENSLWMFASTRDVNASDIRCWMGDFHLIRNVAKYAARLGQSFGSSTETFNVGSHEVEQLPDIETQLTTKYNFSDGIGKISAEFAQDVSVKCGLRGFIPSAFQIRYGGYKGVVAVDPNSQMKLSLRPSMLKYQSENTKLDVLAWSKYHPCFLNRQIITLLSTLGVEDGVFEKKQREAVAQLDKVLVDPMKAQEALNSMLAGGNTRILKEMLRCGYKPNAEPFLSMMLQTFCSSKLLELREKARIFVPQARKMMGCLDETGTLNYGQVFVQLSDARRHTFDESIIHLDGPSSANSYIIKGKVVVAKNPCLHPGDVRVLEAVNVEALHHMIDCVVFPSTGPRPHPNECSGSDLDGDEYSVSWDPELIPSMQYTPMTYAAAPPIELDHDVTIEEVEEFFTSYPVNDNLGVISTAHTVFADKEPSMALSKPCLDLSTLFSVAVDFPKTGIPAEIPPRLRVKVYPDFMEKHHRPMYESSRVIGKLYRGVKDIPSHTIMPFTKEVARSSYDLDMKVEGFEKYLNEAYEYKTEYDYKLGNLMEYFGMKTEAEILSGSSIGGGTRSLKNETEAIMAAVKSLRNEAKSWFERGINDGSTNANAKASAWYHVTYHPDFWGAYNKGLERDHYISFPWCVCDKLVRIKNDKSRRAVTVR